MFPFSDLNDIKLVKLLCKKKTIITKPTQSEQPDANVTIKTPKLKHIGYFKLA